MRGYFGIGIYRGKTETNLGTLWRSAQNFGASFIFTIEGRYHKQASDTTKAWKHIPLYNYITLDEFLNARPYSSILVGVEQTEKSKDIKNFKHPESAIYLLGAEDTGLPKQIQSLCQSIIHISTPMCLNVAVAGSIIMFDRKNRLDS